MDEFVSPTTSILKRLMCRNSAILTSIAVIQFHSLALMVWTQWLQWKPLVFIGHEKYITNIKYQGSASLLELLALYVSLMQLLLLSCYLSSTLIALFPIVLLTFFSVANKLFFKSTNNSIHQTRRSFSAKCYETCQSFASCKKLQ